MTDAVAVLDQAIAVLKDGLQTSVPSHPHWFAVFGVLAHAQGVRKELVVQSQAPCGFAFHNGTVCQMGAGHTQPHRSTMLPG